MNIVMLITSLIIIAVCYWEAQSAAKPNKNIILGVMIPPLELSNMEVTKITKEFIYSIIGTSNCRSFSTDVYKNCMAINWMVFMVCIILLYLL